MKKYLMTGMAAVALCGAFTSCSRESDFGAQTPQQSIQETYETAFKTRFGDPAPEQNWGFGPSVAASRAMTRSGNMAGVTPVAQTSEGINANANEWADAANAPHGHGGWLVPPALTGPQKDLVRQYFQTHTPLEYTDPHWPNFFVQQVYKGGKTKVGDTTEGIKGADGSTQYSSDNMNLLTVGKNNQHINNFNAGSYSGASNSYYDGIEGAVNDDGSVNVLDNGYTVNEFGAHHHSDQIMLMVNIDDTECMGYHCTATGLSVQRNDKAALVGWETIRTWAREQGIYTEDILNDGWNRSFVGFDLALKTLEESYARDNNGDLIYARFDQVPSYNNFKYVWDGEKTIKISEGSSGSILNSSNDIDLSSFVNDNYYWNPKPKMELDILEAYIPGWQAVTTSEFASDWSECESMVVTFAEPTPSNGWINIGTSNNVYIEQAFDANVNSVTINLSDKNAIAKNISIKVQNEATLKISQIHINGTIKEAGDSEETFSSEYLIGDDIKIPFLDSNANQYAGETRTVGESDWTYYDSDGKKCVNLKFFKDLYDNGWRPKDTALRTWAKWEDSDGYYSDWIVTLTEAKRQDENQPDTRTETESLRVIAEDLSVGESTDFDFNDVVFDVIWTKNYTDETLTSQSVKVVLQAAGGTLPLYVAGHEVHGEFGEDTNVMINTKAAEQGYRGNDNAGTREIPLTTDDWSGSDIYAIANSIDIYVIKNETECHLSAPVGGIASKIGVKTNYDWCKERQDIEDKHSLEDGTSPFREWVNGIYPANDWYGYAKNEIVKYRAAKAALNGE